MQPNSLFCNRISRFFDWVNKAGNICSYNVFLYFFDSLLCLLPPQFKSGRICAGNVKNGFVSAPLSALLCRDAQLHGCLLVWGEQLGVRAAGREIWGSGEGKTQLQTPVNAINLVLI